MVRLKVCAWILYRRNPCDFNSTMVRLKDRGHAGSHVGTGFQFHYGTIKRISGQKHKIHMLNFNSTMVRLKDALYLSGCILHPLFQFHYGTIKS